MVDNYQLSSEHIILEIKNNAIDKMNLLQNAFIISEDSLDLYNQIKGRNMMATLKETNYIKLMLAVMDKPFMSSKMRKIKFLE